MEELPHQNNNEAHHIDPEVEKALGTRTEILTSFPALNKYLEPLSRARILTREATWELELASYLSPDNPEQQLEYSGAKAIITDAKQEVEAVLADHFTGEPNDKRHLAVDAKDIIGMDTVSKYVNPDLSFIKDKAGFVIEHQDFVDPTAARRIIMDTIERQKDDPSEKYRLASLAIQAGDIVDEDLTRAIVDSALKYPHSGYVFEKAKLAIMADNILDSESIRAYVDRALTDSELHVGSKAVIAVEGSDILGADIAKKFIERALIKEKEDEYEYMLGAMDRGPALATRAQHVIGSEAARGHIQAALDHFLSERHNDPDYYVAKFAIENVEIIGVDTVRELVEDTLSDYSGGPGNFENNFGAGWLAEGTLAILLEDKINKELELLTSTS